VRRASVDLDAVTAANTRRIDALDRQIHSVVDDLAALGRGLAQLTAQIRRLTDLAGPPAGGLTVGTADAPTGTAAGVDGEIGGEGPTGFDPGAGLPDWIRLDLPHAAVAEDLLGQVAAFLARVGVHLAVPAVACWPLHPAVVVDLLAVMSQYDHAYTGDNPSGVSELLTRWLPATRERIKRALAGCTDVGAHDHDGHLYLAEALDPHEVAAWWTSRRDTPAVAALHLPRI
jgi:hypothetical protein